LYVVSTPTYGTVLRTERLSATDPGLVRVVLGGPGLDGFEAVPWTDAYVNLLFVPDGAPYAVPFDLAEARALERSLWPVPRRFTVRRWDASRRELWIDFVVHGDTGTAGRWAAQARRGDLVQFSGPSGAYRPDPEASTHLFVGDESALPAIAASLEAVPAGARALVVALVEGPDAEITVESRADLTVTWLHRATLAEPAEAAFEAAVAGVGLDPTDLHGFVHGDAVETRAVRRYLLADLGMPRERLSVSPYWRRTFTDESWREVKRDWLAQVEADV
jgi:NADPH-dependent ferric siderophore reductase